MFSKNSRISGKISRYWCIPSFCFLCLLTLLFDKFSLLTKAWLGKEKKSRLFTLGRQQEQKTEPTHDTGQLFNNNNHVGPNNFSGKKSYNIR